MSCVHHFNRMSTSLSNNVGENYFNAQSGMDLYTQVFCVSTHTLLIVRTSNGAERTLGLEFAVGIQVFGVSESESCQCNNIFKRTQSLHYILNQRISGKNYILESLNKGCVCGSEHRFLACNSIHATTK